MRIRSRLLLLVLVVLVPAVLTAVLGVAYVYRTAQRDNQENMREITRAMALVVDKDLARREAALHALGYAEALERADLVAFAAQARRVASGLNATIILINPAGRVLLNTSADAVAADDLGLAAIREQRLRYGPTATIVSNLYFSTPAIGHSFSLGVPVSRAGSIAYYLQMSIPAAHLQAVFEEQKLPVNWIGTIVDREGAVVARSAEAAAYVGEHAARPILDKLESQDEGFNEATTLNGQPVSAYFSRAPQSEWVFVVSVPREQLLQSAIRAAGMVAAVSFLLLALAVGGAFALGRLTAAQIEALRRSARRVGAGLPITAQHSGVREIDAVNAALVMASERIRSNQAEMTRQVQDAVAIAQRSEQALVRGQKLEALGRLTGGIAHDFNNVLQTLTTGLQIATHSAHDPRALSALEACTRSVDRASDLVRRLMAFGRVQEARLETVAVGAQLKAMSPMLQSAVSSNIRFHVDLTDDLWAVTMDPLQFELALLNLTINARDAMPSGGTLRLEASNCRPDVTGGQLVPGDYVRIAVSDTGQGMSEETLARAFDPFFTTKSIGHGSGLGLPQAYGFARQTGGLLTLSSSRGKGTTATFYLPRSGEASSQEAPLVQGQGAVPGANGAAILLVEDDPLVRRVVGPALEAYGYRVTLAEDGEQAVRLLEEGGNFDLVFSDIVMPGAFNGIDLAELVRQEFPAMRVVLATGYSEQRLVVPGVRLLAKPYNVDSLLQTLDSELRPALQD